jgi:4-hydroxy-tetrahydrodipicolinate reductase
MDKIKVAQFGLGPIGLETIKLAATKPWAEVVGGIDIDPAKVGRSLGELTGLPSVDGAKVYGSLESLLQATPVQVIFHTSVSRIAEACAQIEPMARRGISVVSSCEELLFPEFRDARLAASLDRTCREHGARVLGTGVNPGFVMDVLPVCLTGVCREVRGVHVRRVVNATTRRGPLQKKIGSGLPPAEFERLFADGLTGHAGLKDSAALLAHCLGWKLTRLTETCRAVVADHDILTPHVQVKAGQCCGLHQHAEGSVAGQVRLTLDLKMYLDAPDPHDACDLESDPPLSLLLHGGVAGDSATVAALVNAAPRILKAQPRLLLMTDVIVPCVT